LRPIEASLIEAQAALNALLSDGETLNAIDRAGQLLVSTFERRGRVFSFGNGGLMCASTAELRNTAQGCTCARNAVDWLNALKVRQ